MTFRQAMKRDGPLIFNARMQAWEEVRNAVKNGADVEHTNKNQESALHVALLTRDIALPLDADTSKAHQHDHYIWRITSVHRLSTSPQYIATTIPNAWVIN